MAEYSLRDLVNPVPFFETRSFPQERVSEGGYHKDPPFPALKGRQERVSEAIDIPDTPAKQLSH
jgi:hypothetical protein